MLKSYFSKEAVDDRQVQFLSINPFISNAPFLYSLKTSENLPGFLCFQGIEKGWIGNEWVKADLSCSLSGKMFKNKGDVF